MIKCRLEMCSLWLNIYISNAELWQKFEKEQAKKKKNKKTKGTKKRKVTENNSTMPITNAKKSSKQKRMRRRNPKVNHTFPLSILYVNDFFIFIKCRAQDGLRSGKPLLRIKLHLSASLMYRGEKRLKGGECSLISLSLWNNADHSTCLAYDTNYQFATS